MTRRPHIRIILLLCWLGVSVAAAMAGPPERYRQEIALYCPRTLMSFAPVRHAVLEAEQLLEQGFRMPVQTFQLLQDSVREAKVAIYLKQRHPYSLTDRSFEITPTDDSWGGQYHYTISSPSKMGVVAGLFALLQQHLGYGFIHPEETLVPDHVAWPLPYEFSTTGTPRFKYSGLSPRVDVPTIFADEFLNRRRDVVPMAYRHYLQWLIHNGQNQIIFTAPHKTHRWLKGNGTLLLKAAKDHGLQLVVRLPDDEVAIETLHHLSNLGVDEVILGEDWAGIFAFKAGRLPRGLRYRYLAQWGNDELGFENNETLAFDLAHVHRSPQPDWQQHWLRRHIQQQVEYGANLAVSDWPAQMAGMFDLVEYHRNQAWMQYLQQTDMQAISVRHAGLEVGAWLPVWLLMHQTWSYDQHTEKTFSPNAIDALPPRFALLDTVLPDLHTDSLLAVAHRAMADLKRHALLMQPIADTELGQSAAYRSGFRGTLRRTIATADAATLERIAQTQIDKLRLAARELQVVADRIDLGATLLKAGRQPHTGSQADRRKQHIIAELSYALRLTGLRAMHVAFLIEAQLKHRAAQLAEDQAVVANLELAADNRLEQAAFVRKEALQVVDRLSTHFRYARGWQTAKARTHTGHKYHYYYPLLDLMTWAQEEALVRKGF